MPGDVAILLAAADFALRLERLDDAERYVRLAEAAEPGAAQRDPVRPSSTWPRGRPAEALAKAARRAGDRIPTTSRCGAGRRPPRGPPAIRSTASSATTTPWSAPMTSPRRRAGRASRPILADLANALKDVHPYQQHPTQPVAAPRQPDDAPADRLRRRRRSRPSSRRSTRRSASTWPGWARATDPLRRRNTGDYRIQGAWSVRLRPGGFHRDHFHPEGWLSSAFYVETPDAALDSPDKQGWIRFGQPPFADQPAAARRPTSSGPSPAGWCCSRPTCGTAPCRSRPTRRGMTIAFDAVPK